MRDFKVQSEGRLRLLADLAPIALSFCVPFKQIWHCSMLNTIFGQLSGQLQHARKIYTVIQCTTPVFFSLAVILFHYENSSKWGQWFLIWFYFPTPTHFYDNQKSI